VLDAVSCGRLLGYSSLLIQVPVSKAATNSGPVSSCWPWNDVLVLVAAVRRTLLTETECNPLEFYKFDAC
jgi:hypothetical protein